MERYRQRQVASSLKYSSYECCISFRTQVESILPSTQSQEPDEQRDDPTVEKKASSATLREVNLVRLNLEAASPLYPWSLHIRFKAIFQ